MKSLRIFDDRTIEKKIRMKRLNKEEVIGNWRNPQIGGLNLTEKRKHLINQIVLKNIFSSFEEIHANNQKKFMIV